MTAKKTLEEYQIEETARRVAADLISHAVKDLITRGEYDKYTITNDNLIKSQGTAITTLELAEQERIKDKKTVKYQITGIALGFVAQFIVWVIVASNGFKIGGN